MANSTATLRIKSSSGKTYGYSSVADYNEVYQTTQEVDNSNAFISLLNVGTSIAAQTLRDAKMIVVCNKGDTTLEIQTVVQAYKNSSDEDVVNSVDLGGGATALRYINYLLPVGDFIYLPNNRCVSYEGEAGVSACNATSLTDAVPNTDLYLDSGATLGAHITSTTGTSVTVSDLNYFKVGDLIQVGINATTATKIEIMQVTAVASGSGSGALTVRRALYGTTGNVNSAQTDGTSGAVSGAKVYFPTFNTFHDHDKFSISQTDRQGRFAVSNFFGYGRNDDTISDGIVPGSVSIAFYSQPTAKVGLNNINANTESGLTGGTTYEFDIDVTGTDEDVAFTVDSSNTKFGGTNGIVSQIQGALDTKFYDSSSQLFEKQISVNIVDGDLMFKLHEALSTSKIEIGQAADLSSSTNLFHDTAFTGRFPAKTAIPTNVLPKLPIKEGYTTGLSPQVRKANVYMTDNGKGILSGGGGSGTISYETGALSITGPSMAAFTISATYKSAFGGAGDGTTSNAVNVINKISARTTSSKKDGVCEILAFN